MPLYPLGSMKKEACVAGELVTDDDAIDAFLDHLMLARGRSGRTTEVYRLALTRLKEFMAPRSVLDADGSELEAFCGLWLHKKGVVAQSRKPYVSAVRGFFGWAKAKGLVADYAARDLVHPKTGRVLPRTISLANAERLMWAPDLSTFIGIRDAALLGLLIGCGLRVSGLVGLCEGDLQTVQLENAVRLVVTVREKGDRERKLPVPKESEAMLRVYLGHEALASIDRATTNVRGRPDKVLFVNTKHPTALEHEHVGELRRLTRKAVHQMIQRYGDKQGIPEAELHPHALRHLFGTELTEEDVPTLTTQGLMGHADAKSTAIYVHLAMRKLMRVVDKHAPMSKIRTPVGEFLKRMPR